MLRIQINLLNESGLTRVSQVLLKLVTRPNTGLILRVIRLQISSISRTI